MAIVAFCRDEHPKLLNDARYASAFVRGRNDYAYRHDRIAEADLRRLLIAATKLYNGLGKVILNEEHQLVALAEDLSPAYSCSFSGGDESGANAAKAIQRGRRCAALSARQD